MWGKSIVIFLYIDRKSLLYRRDIYKLGKDLDVICVYKMGILCHVFYYIFFCASIMFSQKVYLSLVIYKMIASISRFRFKPM